MLGGDSQSSGLGEIFVSLDNDRDSTKLSKHICSELNKLLGEAVQSGLSPSSFILNIRLIPLKTTPLLTYVEER